MAKSSDLINRKIALELTIGELKAIIKDYEERISSNESIIKRGGYLEPLRPSDVKQLRSEISSYKEKIVSTTAKLKKAESDYDKVRKAMKGSR